LTPYAWLILDADGTLFDFQRAEAIALENTPAELGVQVPGNFSSAYHRINDALWRDFEAGIVTARNIRVERFKRLFEQLNVVSDSDAFSEAFLGNLVRASTFLDGAEELLIGLQRRAGLVLMTNGFADVQHARIKRLGLEDAFDHVIISEEVGVAKPDCGVFDIAFERMGYPDKNRVLMIGDSLSSDILGGSKYGIDTCWFNPDQVANTTDVKPTYEIRQLMDLVDLLFRAKAKDD
jgi:2-haloacid dehalogenase